MFCPKCKAEYRPEFTVCSDCNVSLVSELPEATSEDTKQLPDMVNLYSPNNGGRNERMSNLFEPQGNCPHCGSSQMEYYGFTYGGLHYYFRCLTCHRFTEYRISYTRMLAISIVTLALLIFLISVTVSTIGVNPIIAIIFWFICLILFGIRSKYRWYGFKTIAITELPKDLFIMRAPKKRTRLLIIGVLLIILLAYAGIIIFNSMQQ